MLTKYRNNVVPSGVNSPLGKTYSDLGNRVYEAFSTLQFREGLEAIWQLVSDLNRLIDDRKPWALAKAGSDAELDAVLYELCEGLRWIALLIEPIMPEKARSMWRQLGMADQPVGNWSSLLVWGGLAGGTVCAPAEALFPRLDLDAAQQAAG